MSTPPPPDLARRVNQLDNDVGAIYNMLNAIQTTQQRHGERLAEIGGGLAKVGGTQQRQGNRLEEFGLGLDEVRATQERQGSRLEEIGLGLDEVRATQERQGSRLEEIGRQVGTIIQMLGAGGQQTT